jgi:hypothetical protein
MHGTGNLRVGSANHASTQRSSQHPRLHRRRPDPWPEAISTGNQYSRHTTLQRPPSGRELRRNCVQTRGRPCNGRPARWRQSIDHT